ncbi:MAG: DUF1015 domain-containing protein [Actinomycetes bacterium]
MPRFQPFRGLRYGHLTDVGAVAAPPYDVIHDGEREALEALETHNAVRLILPRESEHGDGYATAAALLRAWRTEGVLATDDTAAFYGYRMAFTDTHGHARVTHGVIGALGLPPDGPGTGDILPHERTISKHRTDRLSLLTSTRANLDPIWGLTPAHVAPLVGEPGPDAQTAADPAGVHHTLWAITEPERVRAIADAVAADPLVLADGHHRFETACAYWSEHPDDVGASAIMTLVVELAEEELWVAPIHRLVIGSANLRDRLAEYFAVEPCGPTTPASVAALEDAMATTGALGFADATGVALLRARPEKVAGPLEAEPVEVRNTDAAMFEAVVLPLLAQATLEFRHDAVALAAAVTRGDADAVVLLRPVEVADIRSASYAGVRMPQKTSFFAPKPRTGLVFRSLDD